MKVINMWVVWTRCGKKWTVEDTHWNYFSAIDDKRFYTGHGYNLDAVRVTKVAVEVPHG